MAAAVVCACRHCVVLAHDRMVDGAVHVRSLRLQARQRAPVSKSGMLSSIAHAGVKSAIAEKTTCMKSYGLARPLLPMGPSSGSEKCCPYNSSTYLPAAWAAGITTQGGR